MFKVSLNKVIRSRKILLLPLFLVVALSVFYIQNYKSPKISQVISLEWQNAEVLEQQIGHLYKVRIKDQDIYIASDQKFDPAYVDKAGNIEYLSTSWFFDPTSCAKMPSVITGDTILFRDYRRNQKNEYVDILFKFNLSTLKLEAYYPKNKMKGDLYKDKDNIYFFEDNKGSLMRSLIAKDFRSYSTAQITPNILENSVSISFDTKLPQVKVSDTSAKDLYYSFDFNDNKFKQISKMNKTSSISSREDALLVPIANSEYIAVFEKGYGIKKVFIEDKNKNKLFTYDGDANLYFITASR